MFGDIRGQVRFKEVLSAYTSLRIGGPADIFVIPQDVEDIRHVLHFVAREHLQMEILGLGNDLLVSDDGVRGMVLRMAGCFGRIEYFGEDVIVGAGVSVGALIRDTAVHGLSGLESLAGVHGTVGAIIATNTGVACLSMVSFVYPDGTLGECPMHGRLEFAGPRGSVVIAARFRLHRAPVEVVTKEVTRCLHLKKLTHPLALASAGYVWSDPRGDVVGLLDRVGLRGKKIGDAEISAKHPNYVLNRGVATAAEIAKLIRMMAHRVQMRFRVTLVPELRIIGALDRNPVGALG